MIFDHIRIRYLLFCLFHRNGYAHGEWLKKHQAFHAMGEKCFFQPWKLPADAKYIRMGSNVVVASSVDFICHDVIHNMLGNMDGNTGEYTTYWGTIDIGDNVFIGSNVTVLANVHIGSNSVIAAGALVNSDVPSGKIVGGVPAGVIGDVENLKKRRKAYSESSLGQMKHDERLRELWKE